MNREIARQIAPRLRKLLDIVREHAPPEGYTEVEELHDAEDSVEMLEELANSEPEPWETDAN